MFSAKERIILPKRRVTTGVFNDHMSAAAHKESVQRGGMNTAKVVYSDPQEKKNWWSGNYKVRSLRTRRPKVKTA